jgi:hypothetical protein
LTSLGRVLGVGASALFAEEQAPTTPPKTTFEYLATRVASQIAAENTNADEWGARVGWDVTGLLADSRQIADLNLDGLIAICAAVGMDWRAVVPD